MAFQKDFIRDGRSPIPEKVSTSNVMRANKGKNTRPELSLRKVLHKNGLRGYRVHLKELPGRPDIAFTRKKLAIFVNGCFWHRCPKCHPSFPKSHTDFWINKFNKNILRDEEKEQELKSQGWNVLVLWECEIKFDLEKCINIISENLLTIQPIKSKKKL